MMKPFESFKFNKAFGQNFLTDKNLLNAIAKDSGISFNDYVLEIGAGAGALTTALSAYAKQVVSFEIDKKLTEFLTEKFSQTSNVKLVFGDALKTPIQQIEQHFEGQNFHIVANLPYYITTPLIFKFLEETTKVLSITVMVQKEVAKKIVAKVGDSDYGITSVLLQYYFDCKIMRVVSKKMFTPQPKVDSAVIKLVRKTEVPFDSKFSNFVRQLFAMKRKTIVNNLTKVGYDKNVVQDALIGIGISASARAESMSYDIIHHLYTNLDK